MMEFSGKQITFIDESQGSDERQDGYFMQLTHSTREDMDYAIVVDSGGNVRCVSFRDVRFVNLGA